MVKINWSTKRYSQRQVPQLKNQRVMNKANEIFSVERDRLRGLAYRMVGSMSDAEDIVQDAWLRWQACDQNKIENPNQFIVRIVSNLSIDRLRANKKRRETYVGSWLPEPNLENFPGPDKNNPEQHQSNTDQISVAFLLALERLSPAERTAFILHDVFAYDYSEVSEILQRSAASCRQLASRARKALKNEKPRFSSSIEEGSRLAFAFQQAIAEGDIEGLTKLLSAETTFISDGGGKVAAVPEPVTGADKVAKMIMGFAKLYRDRTDISSTLTTVNGIPGFILWEDNKPLQTLSLDLGADGLIETIYVVRNPEKLRHINPQHL